MDKTKSKIFIETYGCQMNSSDSEIITTIMQINGYESTENILKANIILINTCSIRKNVEQKIFSRLQYYQSLKKKKYQFIIGVVGCITQKMKEILVQKHNVDLIVGPDSYLKLPYLIKIAEKGKKVISTNLSPNKIYENVIPFKTSKNKISSFVSIMRGCNNFCSYCIVPYTRGKEKSRTLKSIINEIKILQKLGYKEIILLGQNVNSYFHKNEIITDFPHLLELIATTTPEIRIRFTTSHPKDMSDEILKIIAKYNNICKHIHLPVQSGSSKILKAMNRKYTREWYLERIKAIRKIIPEVSISTDLLCGFPDETETDHKKTLSLMREVCFDSAFMFKYSERPGTYAAQYLSDNIPEKTKIKRLNEIISLQLKISLLRNKEYIGKIMEVLIEGFSKRSKEQLLGRTSQNKIVFFKKNNFHQIGDKALIKIKKASFTSLFGDSIM